MNFGNTDINHHYGVINLILIDTEREKEIGLGTDWPYKPLGPGQCIISRAFADTIYDDYAVGIGDKLNLNVLIYNLTQTQADYFNEFEKARFKRDIKVD